MGEGNTGITGGAGEGLPDRTSLTLAEVVSWLAWGRAFTYGDFRLAGGRDWLRKKVARLEAAGRTGDELTEARGELSRAEAKRAEMERAAGGAEYGGEAFADGLGAAGSRLFDAVRARGLAASGKRCERDARWVPVPKDWFRTDPADPRAPVAILDADRVTREGDTPLWQIVGPHARDPERAEDWFAVCFEREDVLRAFPPDAGPLGPSAGSAEGVTLHGPLAGTTPPALGTYRTGAPGRPSSMHLIHPEHARRLTAGEAHTSVSAEAKHLAAWFRSAHPGHPPPGCKAIENAIRRAHRR